jgi:hypothetical protein
MFRRFFFLASLLGALVALPAHAAYQPVCVPKTYTVVYTDNAFKAAATTATKTLVTLPSARVKLCGASEDPRTAYAWTSTDAGTPTMACSLGTATSGNAAVYVPALDVMQTTESASYSGLRNGRDLSTPDTNLAVVLTCTAVGSNFGTGAATYLTAGKLWVTVYTTALPPGQ